MTFRMVYLALSIYDRRLSEMSFAYFRSGTLTTNVDINDRSRKLATGFYLQLQCNNPVGSDVL